jgi:UDP-N-acetylglucosamine/UDP-N-acetylgalactosamine diphosphorylase
MTTENRPTKLEEKVEQLRRQGVEVPAPHTLEIGDEVDLSAVRGPETVLHSGTKLYGDLSIAPGCRIGYEEPATVEGCAVGPGCRLAGGYFSGAVFLDEVVVGKGAHIRGGTLMEEQSNGAHTVGLKQTVLLPFVTLGSLINFCDVLMAGGTSRRDHSEVGSSFIHFNFTPFGRNGDKATPTLVGDVPRGVMLRSPRIFLGGQAGLVGPMHIDYGTVLAAGFVYRRDHGPDELVVGEKLVSRAMPFTPLRYGRIRNKVLRNLTYTGNLVALWHWYERVRGRLCVDEEHRALYRRAQGNLVSGIEERIKRLGQVAGYMEDSVGELSADATPNEREIAAQREFGERWPEMEARLRAFRSMEQEQLYNEVEPGLSRAGGATYVEQIGSMDEETVGAGTRWLAAIVDEVEQVWPKKIPPGLQPRG